MNQIQGTDNNEGSLPTVDMLLAFIILLIVLIMSVQVLFRYVFNNSISWSEEVVRYLFVWMTFLGAAVCFRDRMHIRVDYFKDVLPKKIGSKLNRFNRWIMLAFTFYLFVGGLIWVVQSAGAYGSSVKLPINIILYGALPVSSGLAAYYLMKDLTTNKR